MSTNHNPSPPMMDSYEVDSDEKTMSPNVVSPLPPDKLFNGSNSVVSDNLCGPRSSPYNDVTEYNDNYEYSISVNGANTNGQDVRVKKDNEEDQSSGYGSCGLKFKNNIGIDNNYSDTAMKFDSTNNMTKRKSPSPNNHIQNGENNKEISKNMTKVHSSEDDDSISCKTMNGDGDLSNEENLISQRIDLDRQRPEDGRNSTSPSSMSSNLSQHSQSSILNLINTHEAKRNGINSGI